MHKECSDVQNSEHLNSNLTNMPHKGFNHEDSI